MNEVNNHSIFIRFTHFTPFTLTSRTTVAAKINKRDRIVIDVYLCVILCFVIDVFGDKIPPRRTIVHFIGSHHQSKSNQSNEHHEHYFNYFIFRFFGFYNFIQISSHQFHHINFITFTEFFFEFQSQNHTQTTQTPIIPIIHPINQKKKKNMARGNQKKRGYYYDPSYRGPSNRKRIEIPDNFVRQIGLFL